MAVNVELWQPLVKEQLFKSNEFLSALKNTDEYVVGGRIVHIPQSGGASNVEKNRSSLPATVTDRNDTDIVYPLHELTTDPRRVSNMDTVELSYNKMSSIIREDTEAIMERAGDEILIDVAVNCPETSKIPTTGAASAPAADGATGLRKNCTAKDVKSCRVLLNKQNIPKADRFMILEEEMFDQLTDDADQSLSYSFQSVNDIKEGTMGRLYGFNMMTRSTVLTVDAAQAIKAYGAANAATDSVAGLFFQKQFLERALGDINVFEKMKDPQFYSDIISFLIRYGARANRADNKGYGIIYRDAA